LYFLPHMLSNYRISLTALAFSAGACLSQAPFAAQPEPAAPMESAPTAASVSAAMDPAGLLTLDQAIRIAVENNYSLSLSREETGQAVIARQGAAGNFLPSASADVNHSGPLPLHSSVPVTTVGASVNWEIFDGLQDYHAYRRLRTREQQASLAERAALENLVETVVVGYYDLVQQKQRLSAIAELLSVSRERAGLAQAKLSVGAGSKLDQLQSRADLNEDSSTYLNQELSLEKAKVSLNQLLARDAAIRFEVADSIPLAPALPLDDWRKDLEEHNAAISAARAGKLASAYSVDEARGRWLPSLSTGVSYGATPDFLNSSRAIGVGHDGFGYSVNLSIPLFDRLATPTAVRQAKAGLRGDEIRLRQTIDQASADFEQARRQYETGLRQISLEEGNLQVARLQAEAAQERYKLGASSPLEFRDAQTRLLDAEGRLITARQSAKQAEVSLQRLSGLLIKQVSAATAPPQSGSGK
jgi:outer membrane protein